MQSAAIRSAMPHAKQSEQELFFCGGRLFLCFRDLCALNLCGEICGSTSSTKPHKQKRVHAEFVSTFYTHGPYTHPVNTVSGVARARGCACRLRSNRAESLVIYRMTYEESEDRFEPPPPHTHRSPTVGRCGSCRLIRSLSESDPHTPLRSFVPQQLRSLAHSQAC